LSTLRLLFVLLTAVFCGPIGCGSSYQGPLQEGDILFQDLPCEQSEAVKLATHSKYSHVGIILLKNGQPNVYEAVGPVKFTPLKNWIGQGEGAHFVAKRLKKAGQVLTPPVLKKMEEVALGFKGKAYDWTFNWSDEEMYCSEMVWKVYQRSTGLTVGRLQKLKDFDFSTPIVQAQLKEKYGDRVPWNEPVISPEQMFESDLLFTVESK
jgi:hypothetical protein